MLDLLVTCFVYQVVEDGYEFFAKRQLVTLFSAPNYCGEFDNAGAMMSVDETLMCSFQILKPTERKQKFPIGNHLGHSVFGLTLTLFVWKVEHSHSGHRLLLKTQRKRSDIEMKNLQADTKPRVSNFCMQRKATT